MTESISNQHTLDSFAQQINQTTHLSAQIRSENPEESILFAAHTYRALNATASDLGADAKILLEIGTLFAEANALLTQLSKLEAQSQGEGKTIKAKLANRKAPLVKRLEEVRQKIVHFETENSEKLALIKAAGGNVKELFDQQEVIRKKLDLKTPEKPAKTESKPGLKEKEDVIDALLENAEVPTNTAVQFIGIIKRFDAFFHTKIHTEELTRAGAGQVFRLGLITSFIAIPFLLMSAVNGMAQIGKRIKRSSDIKQKLKAIKEEKATLNQRMETLQKAQVESPDKALKLRLSNERHALEGDWKKLVAYEEKFEKKLQKSPLSNTLRSIPVAGSLVELSGRVLEVVKTFFEHGAHLSTRAMAHLSIALHVLGPVAAAISTIISGAMLKKAKDRLDALKLHNATLRTRLDIAESKMHPYRRQIKQEMEQIRKELAIKNLTPRKRQDLELSLQDNRDLLVDIRTEDLIEEFFELETDRLKMELLANNREIGLMRLSVANSAVLTVGGLFAFAATIGSPGFGVTTSLYGVALTLLGVSLGLSLAHYIKSKHSAKNLLIQQESYKLNEQDLDQRVGFIRAELLTPYSKNPQDRKPEQEQRFQNLQAKQNDLNQMWEALIASDSSTWENLTPAQRDDPNTIQAALKKHFSALQQKSGSKESPEE